MILPIVDGLSVKAGIAWLPYSTLLL